jgi:phosphatidylglycerol:prolipoprotein diacylglycerol transferase
VVAGIFFMIDCRRKRYPILECSIIYSSAVIFLIIGSKLFTYSTDDWIVLINTWSFPYPKGNTIIGGIIGGIFGIWISKKLIHFNFPILDSFSVSLPLAMSIQRIGCFLVGCCYGTPTNLPWAVEYSCHTHAYEAHLSRGLIDTTSLLSLPIHPNQLYQTILCMIIAFTIWKLRNYWKRSGNLFLTSIVLYFIARFIVEFWRDNESNGYAGIEWLGVKYVQWGLLLAVILLIPFILIRERKNEKVLKVFPAEINPLWYLTLLSVFVLIIQNWYSKTEFMFIEFLLLPTVILGFYSFFGVHFRKYKFRFFMIYLLTMVLILSGTMTAQMAYKELTKDSTDRNYFNDVTIDYGNFGYSHYHSQPSTTWVPPGNGCLGPYDGYYRHDPVGSLYPHKSNSFGIGINHIRTEGKYNRITLAGNFSIGWDSQNNSNTNNTIITYDFSPFAKVDFRWFGFSFGLHTGKMMNEKKEYSFYFSEDHVTDEYVNFSGSVRLFPYDIFYIEIRNNEIVPYQIGHRSNKAIQFLLGTGLGFKNGNKLEAGISGFGAFISLKAYIKEKYGIKATMTFPRNSEYISQLAQFSLIYRFSWQHWHAKSKDF